MTTPLGEPPIVIPAHPLAVTDDRTPDWSAQRLLTRYYLAAGATGLAVGVHTTQFEVHDDRNLFERVLTEARDVTAQWGHGATLVAGICGDLPQAVEEARLAASLGYTVGLLSLYGMTDRSEQAQLARARAVAAEIPLLGFYMQESVGGCYLSPDYWRQFFAIDGVLGAKLAPFDRYRTRDAMEAAARSPRWDQLTMLTGNDDTIVSDLLLPMQFHVDGEVRTTRFSGGLLGQWAVGTRAAREVASTIWAHHDRDAPRDLLPTAAAITEINQAIFDPENGFAGAVAGVNELLRQQGLMESSACLTDRERLSPGQAERIATARERFPELVDEQFIAENLEQWKSDVA